MKTVAAIAFFLSRPTAWVLCVSLLTGGIPALAKAHKKETHSTNAIRTKIGAQRAPSQQLVPPFPPGVQRLITQYCVSCHAVGRPQARIFGSALDVGGLISNDELNLSDIANSTFYQRIQDGTMPQAQPGVAAMSAADRTALLQGLVAFGQSATAAASSSVTQTHGAEANSNCPNLTQILEEIRSDVQHLDAAARPFVRYLFIPLSSQEAVEDGLNIVLNSLSRNRSVSPVFRLSSQSTLRRFDLRSFAWDRDSWESVQRGNPLATLQRPLSQDLFRTIGTDAPFADASWFVAATTKAPLYYDLVRIPQTLNELAQGERVDLSGISQRSGFRNSGVSANNRIIARYNSSHGSFWVSSDFADNLNEHDIFQHPLEFVPAGAERDSFSPFVPAGGEVIFNLPNGLQAYGLYTGAGRRLDVAPINIVSDPNRTDRTVRNAVSCMRCHAAGLLDKEDQIRDYVASSSGFSATIRQTVSQLYLPRDSFIRVIQTGSRRHTNALRGLGLHSPEPAYDPVSEIVAGFEGDLTREQAACELHLSDADLSQLISSQGAVLRTLEPLISSARRIPRDIFAAAVTQITPPMLESARSGGTGNRTQLDQVPDVCYGDHCYARDQGRCLLVSRDTDGRAFYLGLAQVVSPGLCAH